MVSMAAQTKPRGKKKKKHEISQKSPGRKNPSNAEHSAMPAPGTVLEMEAQISL